MGNSQNSHPTTQLSHSGMSQPVLYSPRRVSMSRIRSKSLVHSENDRISSRRNSFQRQNSIDISNTSGTIMEEISSSSPPSSTDENNRSYLSVKRASLKKRLRLKTISSKSEAEDSTTTGRMSTFVNLQEYEKNATFLS